LDPTMDLDIGAEHSITLHHQERFSFRVVLGPIQNTVQSS
jgi:hypothetical protein